MGDHLASLVAGIPAIVGLVALLWLADWLAARRRPRPEPEPDLSARLDTITRAQRRHLRDADKGRHIDRRV